MGLLTQRTSCFRSDILARANKMPIMTMSVDSDRNLVVNPIITMPVAFDWNLVVDPIMTMSVD